MIRFQGDSILVVDFDQDFTHNLSATLTSLGANCVVVPNLSHAMKILLKREFRMVVSNYYLSDGIIHQLIDWGRSHLASPPIYTCVGYPFPADLDLVLKNSIADFFSKNDHQKIIDTLSGLLFDFTKFRDSFLELRSAEQIHFEMSVEGKNHQVLAIELFDDFLNITLGQTPREGMHGVLIITLRLTGRTEQLAIPGFFEGTQPESSMFMIHKDYCSNWLIFLSHLKEKNIYFNFFMSKDSAA